MLDYALANKRMIGMVQPKEKVLKNSEIKNPNLYQIGCAGRVTAFSETKTIGTSLFLKEYVDLKSIKKKIVNGFDQQMFGICSKKIMRLITCQI